MMKGPAVAAAAAAATTAASSSSVLSRNLMSTSEQDSTASTDDDPCPVPPVWRVREAEPQLNEPGTPATPCPTYPTWEVSSPLLPPRKAKRKDGSKKKKKQNMSQKLAPCFKRCKSLGIFPCSLLLAPSASVLIKTQGEYVRTNTQQKSTKKRRCLLIIQYKLSIYNAKKKKCREWKNATKG